MNSNLDSIEIQPSGPIHAAIRPPGSKSITNRALVCAALANGTSKLTGCLDSEDTQVMLQGLQQLGIEIDISADRTELQVQGCGGHVPGDAGRIHVGNSGTTIRFLTAMLSLGQGEYVLDGIERMRQRPIGDLLDALNSLGGNLVAESPNRCPPVKIDANGLTGGEARIRGDISSQYLSGLLMAVPCAQAPCRIAIDGLLVSKPYVEMTLRVMESFGCRVTRHELESFDVPNTGYQAADYDVEPDASAASYFWGAAAVTGGEITVQGLNQQALQGDVAFCECLEKMGCDVNYADNGITVRGNALTGIEVDMNAISDTVQTLAVVALFADSPTTVRNVAHIRHKETDRISDLARELRKLGAQVEEFEDGLQVVPAPLKPAVLDTYNDHRMAMSFALAGLRQSGVVINDPNCTVKTYPRYFEDLAAITASK